VIKTIRSRTNVAVDGIFDGKWKVVARRVIAEPTARTKFEAPRLGIYDYDVVPHDAGASSGLRDVAPASPAEGTAREPLVSFRKIGQ
jgi:hypothetical protein